MLKIILGGILVGMANIIPGVSGGTMMVIFGIFTPLMMAISSLTSLKGEDKLKHIKFLVALLIGIGIGLLIFSRLMELCLEFYPTQTMFCFVGMIAFSVPILKKKEMKDEKFNIIPFLIGAIVIIIMYLLAPAKTDTVIEVFPNITFWYLIKMSLLGFIAGFAMFLPGISGSMILLILNEYYLFNSLLANVFPLQIIVLVPLAFLFVGLAFGVILSTKFAGWALKKNRAFSMNVILGLVFASIILIIPYSAHYDLITIVSSLIALIIGGLAVYFLEKLIK